MSAQLLHECRQSFGRAPRVFPPGEQSYLTLKPPAWCRLRMDPLMRFYNSQQQIREQGHVVWGHLVQANQLLFEPGSDDCPASAIYSLDPWFDDHLDELADIASRLFDLKGRQSTDPLAAQIARYLTAETERQVSLPVPRHWTQGREVFIGDVMVHRKHLPTGYLAQSFFPVAVLPHHGMMIVPSRYWGESLLAAWQARSPTDAVQLDTGYERQPSSSSWLAKVLIGVVGAMLLVSLLCAGLVGGLVFAFRAQQRPAIPAQRAPVARPPAWNPPAARQIPPPRHGQPPDFERMQAEHRRLQEEMQQRMEEQRRRSQELMEEHRRRLNQ
jgi:hypothetical protein